jgi:Tfp pilus assembly protein PilW
MKSIGKNQTLNKRNGFTMVELLLYVGIASVMLVVISVFLTMLVSSRIKNQTIAEVEQQGLQAMQIITQSLRNADDINEPAFGNDAASLSFKTVTTENDPTIFTLVDGAIQIKEGAGAEVPLTNSRVIVSDLSFSNLSRADTPGTVRIRFTVTHLNFSGRNEYDFSKTFIGSASLRQP